MTAFREGLRDGLPIGLGYFAVAFSLGVAARDAGMNAFQGFVASLFTLASAGEYVAFSLMAAQASLAELAIATVVTNARYLLMGCALSQKLDPKTPFWHRPLIALGITDELFGIAIGRPGRLEPAYNYGSLLTAAPLWALGTSIGILAGTLLPLRLVSALSVALFGMFLAVIIPPAKTSKILTGLIAVSFAASLLLEKWSLTASISSGTRTIIITVVVAAAAAVLFPVKEEEEEAVEQ